ncbi:hypothetical protein SAMN02910356_00504 [Selenomonas sp. GACV-9]|uniref:hypothetical protein n=1 Tax=Selenomonas sp. GACV-9 TaxID=3158782 RepID=UPI0008EC1248|nr:hypothetical protein SAMN02910356_00504 [Selenomonas ruminantium]
MPNIFDGFNNVDDQGIREQIAVLETVTIGNVLGVYGQKAYKGVTSAINFIGSFFDKKVIKEPTIKEIDEQIADCVKSMECFGRATLNQRLRQALADRTNYKNSSLTFNDGTAALPQWCDDEKLSIAVVDGAAKLLDVDLELTPAEKIEIVNQRYAERMLTQMRKKIKEKGPAEERRLAAQLDKDIAKLSTEEREAMRRSLKIDDISGETIQKLIMTTGGTTLVMTVMSSMGGYIAMTTIMHALFTTALGITLPFAAYTGAASIAGFLTGPVGWAILAGVGIWQFTSGSSKVDGEVLAQSVFLARTEYRRPFTALDEELPSWISPSDNPEAYKLRQEQEEEIARLQADLEIKSERLAKEERLRRETEEVCHQAEQKKSQAEKNEKIAREKLKEMPRLLQEANDELNEYELRLKAESNKVVQNEQAKREQENVVRQLRMQLRMREKNLEDLRNTEETMSAMLDEAAAQQEESSNIITQLTVKIEELSKSCELLQIEKNKATEIANKKIDKRKEELANQLNIFFTSDERNIRIDDEFLRKLAKLDSKLLYDVERKMKEIYDAENPEVIGLMDRGKMNTKQGTLHCKIRKSYRLHYLWKKERKCVVFVGFFSHNEQDKKF